MAIAVTALQKCLNGTELYQNLSFRTKPNSITAVFGPNGSGKTTLFNLLCGILDPDNGTISLPARPSYLFQNYRESLLPWRTGYENLSFPLQLQGLDREKIDRRVRKFLKNVNVALPLEKYPYEMSGGQQQMLAILRTLIVSPKVLLLDEPFSALDYENALRQRNLVQEYHMRNGGDILIITHDIEEAVYLADRIIVLSHKPTSVVGVVTNALPYPRDVNAMKSQRFHETTTDVLRLFQQAMAP
jgi:NitT/TauT family transport system ATP-binding protein